MSCCVHATLLQAQPWECVSCRLVHKRRTPATKLHLHVRVLDDACCMPTHISCCGKPTTANHRVSASKSHATCCIRLLIPPKNTTTNTLLPQAVGYWKEEPHPLVQDLGHHPVMQLTGMCPFLAAARAAPACTVDHDGGSNGAAKVDRKVCSKLHCYWPRPACQGTTQRPCVCNQRQYYGVIGLMLLSSVVCAFNLLLQPHLLQNSKSNSKVGCCQRQIIFFKSKENCPSPVDFKSITTSLSLALNNNQHKHQHHPTSRQDSVHVRHRNTTQPCPFLLRPTTHWGMWLSE